MPNIIPVMFKCRVAFFQEFPALQFDLAERDEGGGIWNTSCLYNRVYVHVFHYELCHMAG